MLYAQTLSSLRSWFNSNSPLYFVFLLLFWVKNGGFHFDLTF